MTRSAISLACALLVVLTAACGSAAETAEDHEHAEGEAEHAHGPDGEHLPDAAAAIGTRQGGTSTVLGDSVAVFVEHPALVVGALGRFAVHLTDAADYQPLTSGAVTFRFVPRDGGSPVVVTQDAPREPGIYAPAPDFARAGEYDLSVVVSGPQATDSVVVPGLRVFARAADAPPAQAPDTTGIAYTMEQQWQTPGFRLARAVAADGGAGVTVPTSAILREDDARVAYVLRTGEHFEKRTLTLGAATGGRTAVTAGIQPGEYVVSGGAAQLRRETLSPADRAHGHSH